MDTSSVDAAARFALSFDNGCRLSLSVACARGDLDLLAYWLDDSSLTPRPLRVNDFVPYYDHVRCYGWRKEACGIATLGSSCTWTL